MHISRSKTMLTLDAERSLRPIDSARLERSQQDLVQNFSANHCADNCAFEDRFMNERNVTLLGPMKVPGMGMAVRRGRL